MEIREVPNNGSHPPKMDALGMGRFVKSLSVNLFADSNLEMVSKWFRNVHRTSCKVQQSQFEPNASEQSST